MINDIDAPWEPLPDHFRKGVNLGYAYATEMYRWTIRPDALWPNTNTPDPTDGWLTGVGHDTTNPNRVSQLFTATDFEIFRQGMSGNPGFPNVKYFDHVVVNIDPRVFGADVNTAAVPATEYERVYPRPAVGGLPQKTPFTYRPYQMGDMWSAGFPFGQEDFFTKFIYVVHQYSPFHYTHPQNQEAFTRNQLKYQGRFDADLTGTGRSWFGPENPPPPPAPNVPQNFPTVPPFQYNDFVLRNFDPLTPYPYERPFGRWHNSWQNPATMVTEFGVLERGYRDRIVPAPDLGVGESDPILPPGQLAEHDLMRARWHWDNRVWFENRNIGWSVWESFSGWNVFNGNLEIKDPNGNWIFNPSDRYQPLPAPRAQEASYPQFFPAMRAALFGARP